MCGCVERYIEVSQLTQLQSLLKKTCLGFLADLLFVWLLFLVTKFTEVSQSSGVTLTK